MLAARKKENANCKNQVKMLESLSLDFQARFIRDEMRACGKMSDDEWIKYQLLKRKVLELDVAHKEAYKEQLQILRKFKDG